MLKKHFPEDSVFHILYINIFTRSALSCSRQEASQISGSLMNYKYRSSPRNMFELAFLFPPTTITMITFFSWISEIHTGAWLLIFLLAWFGLIFYCITWKQYVDKRELDAERHAADQQRKCV
jgi:hypothetical protein